MEVSIVHDKDEFRFFATVDKEEAELTYTFLEDNLVDLDYTFIPENYRNKGLSNKLVKAALEYIKAQNFMFIPSCPVVETYVKRHPEYKHLMR